MTATTPLPEGFIPHDGGPCPVGADVRLEVVYRDGTRGRDPLAGDYEWSHSHDDVWPDFEIIAYRVIPAPAEPIPDAEGGAILEALQDACCQARNTYQGNEHGGPDPDEHWARVIQRALPGRYLHALANPALRPSPPAPEGEDWQDIIRSAYLAGCEATHKAVQAEPELALNTYPEFGEAADDYAADIYSKLTARPAGEAPKTGIAAHLPSQEWLTRKVETDPDLDCEAGSAPQPVAWRVKDYADGWILMLDREGAMKLSGIMGGAVVEALYPAEALLNRPSSPSLEEVRGVLEPFARLAKQFAGQTIVEVCQPHPSNPSPRIAPLPVSSLEAARTLLTRIGAGHGG